MGSDGVAESKPPSPTLITVRAQCPHVHNRGGGEDQGFSDLFLSRGCFVQREPEAVGQPGRWMKTRGSPGVSTAGRGLPSHQRGCRVWAVQGADPRPRAGLRQQRSPPPQTLGRGNSVGGTAGLTGPPRWGSQSSAAGTAGSGPRHQARGQHRSAAFAPAAVRPGLGSRPPAEGERRMGVGGSRERGPDSGTAAHRGQAPVHSPPHPAASNCSGLRSPQRSSRDQGRRRQ